MSPNQTGFATLLKKEVMRFWAVLGQTVSAPVITALLYLLVFAQALQGRMVEGYEGVNYSQFLVPGLVMMTIIQNAFANSSSSLIQSKVMGNLVFTLMAPLSTRDWFGAYVLAALVRAALVGSAMLAVSLCFVPMLPKAPLALLATFVLAGSSMAALGIIAGLWAQKFDHLAAFTNFLITPLSFLSGVFYTVHSLPPVWKAVSHLNPFFYMIDGFRYGFFGHADVAFATSLLWMLATCAVCSAGAWWILASGYRVRR